MGLGEWWSYIGKVKKSSDVVPFAEATTGSKAAVIDAGNCGEMGVDTVVKGGTNSLASQVSFFDFISISETNSNRTHRRNL